MLRGNNFCLTTMFPGRNYTAVMGWATGILLLGNMLLLAACDPTPVMNRCVVGADCASGVCLGDGTCAPPQETDGGAAGRDAGRLPPGFDGGPRDAGPSGRCVPNEDGVISRAEAPFGPDLMVRYVVASDTAVNTTGSDVGGTRTWDYGDSFPGDHDFDAATERLDGRWFADRFVGADYVSRLSDQSDLLGVFRINDSALELLGVVSPNDGVGRTELTYDPPVRLLTFPLELGNRWTTDTRATGLAEGLAANVGETYESEVDARGEVITPYAPFDALRVRVTLTRDVGLLRTVTRQFLFVAECFGTVATVVSEEDETEIEFSEAAEIRRLGF